MYVDVCGCMLLCVCVGCPCGVINDDNNNNNNNINTGIMRSCIGLVAPISADKSVYMNTQSFTVDYINSHPSSPCNNAFPYATVCCYFYVSIGR